uniref:DB domain-containing protein n=1 Tax=Panagrellus redivivus TaxID=6233 RepID=A0A7E4V2L9_PANRE
MLKDSPSTTESVRVGITSSGIMLKDDSVDITNHVFGSVEETDKTDSHSTVSVMSSEMALPLDETKTTNTVSAELDKSTAMEDGSTTIQTRPVLINTQVVDVTKSQFIRLRSYANSLEGLNKNPFIGYSKTTRLQRSKEKYCHMYIPKFTYYCQGPGRLTIPQEKQPRLAAFCVSVKDTCFPEKVIPCTPDCDKKLNPHCTASCKCDYLYPLIVKFCAPLAVPFLENICRSWFVGCAKMYELDIMDVETFLFPQNAETRTTWTKDEVLPLENVPVKKPRHRIHQVKNFPIVASETAEVEPSTNFHKFDQFTDQAGVLHRPRSRSPWSKPGLWEANPDNPHNRDHANKFYYAPRSVTADWLSGQIQWGAHWAVPAAGVGGTDGFSAIHFPSIGNFLNIADDYD